MMHDYLLSSIFIFFSFYYFLGDRHGILEKNMERSIFGVLHNLSIFFKKAFEADTCFTMREDESGEKTCIYKKFLWHFLFLLTDMSEWVRSTALKSDHFERMKLTNALSWGLVFSKMGEMSFRRNNYCVMVDDLQGEKFFLRVMTNKKN